MIILFKIYIYVLIYMYLKGKKYLTPVEMLQAYYRVFHRRWRKKTKF